MIVAGIGLRAAATAEALDAALTATGQAPDTLACLEAKATPALRDMARARALPLTLLTEAEIAGIETPTRSARILARFATGSVAEAAALAALRKTGHEARIIAPRVTSPCGRVTVALAQGRPI